MAAHDPIQPVDDVAFSLDIYNEAFRKSRHDPASISDVELKTLACYDPDLAAEAAQQRADILTARATEVQQRAAQEREARERQAQRRKALEARQQRDDRRAEARRQRAAEPREPDVRFLPTVTYDRATFDHALKLMQDDPAALTDADIAQLAVVDASLVGSVERLRAHRQSADDEEEDDEDLSHPVTLTVGGVRNLVGGIAASTKDYYNPKIARMFERITRAMQRITELELRAGGTEARDEQAFTIVQLKARIEALESRPHLEYLGVWKSQPYPRGSAVTFQGSLWIASRDTDAQPSIAAPDVTGWTLAVKRGADGKDHRP